MGKGEYEGEGLGLGAKVRVVFRCMVRFGSVFNVRVHVILWFSVILRCG